MSDAPRWKGLPMSYFEKPVEAERENPHDPNSKLAPCLCEGCVRDRIAMREWAKIAYEGER